MRREGGELGLGAPLGDCLNSPERDRGWQESPGSGKEVMVCMVTEGVQPASLDDQLASGARCTAWHEAREEQGWPLGSGGASVCTGPAAGRGSGGVIIQFCWIGDTCRMSEWNCPSGS